MNRLILMFFMQFPIILLACSCFQKDSVTMAVKNADVVFSGRVVSTRTLQIIESGSPNARITRVEYAFIRTTFYKGNKESDTIKIITGNGNGDCGFRFQVGLKYIVYANIKNTFINEGDIVEQYLTTNICTRTKIWSLVEKRLVRSTIRKQFWKLKFW